MKVCESVSLGDKRFMAIVRVDGQQYLVGGATNAVSLLAHLPGQESQNQPDESGERHLWWQE